MKRGDKVIFRSNTPRILWGVDINYLLGNICTIKSIIELTSKTFERKAYELEEASDYWFPAEEFIPYKGLTVLIDNRTDLVGGLEYPYSNPSRRKLYFASAMEKFRGEEYEIVASLDDYGCETYSLSLGEEESKWVFNDAMLILVDGLRSLICKRNIK